MILDQALQIVQNQYGITGTIKLLYGEVDYNFLLTTDDQQYTLKISRAHPDKDLLDLQNQALIHLEQKNTSLEYPYVIKNKDGQYLGWHGNHAVRLLKWIPGRLWSQLSIHTPQLLHDLGTVCGQTTLALQGFDHPHAHRFFKWDNQRFEWIEEHLEKLQSKEQKELFQHFLFLIKKEALPHFTSLRKSIVHNDANDNNIIVNEDRFNPKVSTLIDFGDIIYTYTINELAIALAYAIMEKPDPLAAAIPLLKGFHSVFPLREIELKVLYHLVAIRLLISLTNAAINRLEEPENEYHFVSEKMAWDLLTKWAAVDPNFAYYSFRAACGLEAHPKAKAFHDWAKQQEFAPIIGESFDKTPYLHLDLRVGGRDLGNNSHFESIGPFTKKINRLLEDAEVEIGLGGYGEIRPVYTTDAYQIMGNKGPQWRTMHIGLDIWLKSGMPIFIPLDGIVESVQDNAADRDYGPTLIVKHGTADFSFYTLYGHIGAEVLENLKVGQKIPKGQQIATIGAPPRNGNWPPHLHFQIMLDLLGNEGDFPGVVFPHERHTWLSICPDPNLLINIPQLEDRNEVLGDHLIHQRRSSLGKSLSISYNQPLHVVRGFKQYLYTTNGRRYLDTVNNVAHVGHEHPRVVKAAQHQIGLLNTNSRYLHQHIVAFAESLLATLPPELCVVHFVNSGSEANELAMRMAHTWSGHRDMIGVEVGYHGNTIGTVDVSSYKFDGKGGKGAPLHTQVVPIPDSYRGKYRGEDTGAAYAKHIEEAIHDIQQEGRNVAGFICESVLSCGGQVVLPKGYLAKAYEYVRSAGGLCIADEVQVGFGRVGSHFWGFELQGVIPDVVTMGKPIGNGHPLAAVVCTRAVADAFANGMEYFNTFGGNPVSSIIGKTVLKIIREEGLQENALQVGAYLRTNLLQLQSKFPIIGDVRGPGLFQGIELVNHPNTLEPAAKEAAFIANQMRQYGVLMSTDGPFYNVLKIKPPMCFHRKNVDLMIGLLEKTLKILQ